MIKYALKCSQGHQFESWFASAQAYEDLRARGLTPCVVCGDTQIDKALMAPQVQTEPSAPPPAKRPADTPQLEATEAEQAIAKLRAHVEANSDYVGADFAQTARDIHDGHEDPRAIHGEANPDEARALLEDGIPVLPLPFGPKTKAN